MNRIGNQFTIRLQDLIEGNSLLEEVIDSLASRFYTHDQALDTGCDGVLVARGAFGNPWIFQELEAYLQHGITPEEKDLSVKKAVLKRHLAYIQEHKEG
ncbi:MAG: hypothetical protein HGB17_16980 [Syntrophobacteraceae bacterium]|nr:hypothetical protein [Syntrophobacteraceae bacterium]